MSLTLSSLRRRRVRRVGKQVIRAIKQSQGDPNEAYDLLQTAFPWLLLFELGFVLLRLFLELYTDTENDGGDFDKRADTLLNALAAVSQLDVAHLELAAEDALEDGLDEQAYVFRWLAENHDLLSDKDAEEFGESLRVDLDSEN